jgi:uncharacterized protein YjdB
MKKIYCLFLLAFLPLLAYADAIEIKGIYYNLDSEAKTAEVTKNPNKYTGEIVIPKTVKNEGITYKVTSIGDFAFEWCKGLTSVTIPNSVTTICLDAFSGCSGLTTITIPGSVTKIGTFAFHNCTGLTSVSIPNSVTHIGLGAFEKCTGLTSVTIPNSVTYIGSYAFKECSSLTSIIIPNKVTFINSYVFKECTSLSTILIPNGVTSIGKGSFEGCSHLTIVSINKDILEIDNRAFANCTALTNVYCFAEDIPNTAEDAFEESNIQNATLRVPAVSLDAYKAEMPWSNFKKKVKISVTVKLNKPELYIGKGKTEILIPTVTPSTLLDKSVTWKSSNTKVATVTSSGKVKGVKAGTATITCTTNATQATTTCKVTVVNGDVTLNKSEAIIEKGKTMKLKATVLPTTLEDKSVTWMSSDPKIATVTSSGKVKGVKSGTAIITCTSNATKLSATCKVTIGKVVISMSEFTLKKSRTTMLTATVYPSSLEDKSVTWESSDTKIATVTSDGKVKGIKAGTATITCTSVATGLRGTCTVTVLATSESRSLDGDNEDVTGIETIDEAPAITEPFDVYDLSGQKVLNQVTSLNGLPAGIYIVNGKKVMKK